MAIYEPTLILTKADREVLFLLGQLALSTFDGNCPTNLDAEDVPLSPSEAERLLQLLQEFESSKRFVEGSYFTEEIANGGGWTNDRLKEIYLSWRSRSGRTRVASTYTWNEFVVRAGFNTSSDSWMWPRSISSPVRPMTLKHFVSMERKLIDTIGLDPRVKALIATFVEAGLAQLDDLREGKTKIRSGAIRTFVQSFVQDLADRQTGREALPMKRKRVIALSTILIDTSALFVTRDWTAAGVLSTIASVAPDAF